MFIYYFFTDLILKEILNKMLRLNLMRAHWSLCSLKLLFFNLSLHYYVIKIKSWKLISIKAYVSNDYTVFNWIKFTNIFCCIISLIKKIKSSALY